MPTPSSYFLPSISIDAANQTDHSRVVGLVPTLLMPANVERAGYMIQNLNDTNDLWFGYDSDVAIDKLGYWCIKGGDKKIWTPPANGIWRGPIYALSDGGGRVTAKSWVQT